MNKKPVRTDWFQVFTDLRDEGVTLDQISAATGINRSSLLFYRDGGGEPAHWRGQFLIRIWQAFTRNAGSPPTTIRYPSIRKTSIS